MARIIMRSGYDFARKFTFKLDGVAEDLSAATIKASVKNDTKTSEIIIDTAQTNTGGADWANGIVVLAFTSSQTAALAAQNAYIEIAVVISGQRIPYEDVPIVIETGYTLS